jgi:hypothetical protein
MNRLSTSLFGQLFYLRNGLFTLRGLPFAQKNGYYNEIFSRSSLKHSSLHFKLGLHGTPENKAFFFESLIDLEGNYRELYRFDASHFGAKEKYALSEVVDGWFQRELEWQDMAPLLTTLTQVKHIVHDSSCFTDKYK